MTLDEFTEHVATYQNRLLHIATTNGFAILSATSISNQEDGTHTMGMTNMDQHGIESNALSQMVYYNELRQDRTL